MRKGIATALILALGIVGGSALSEIGEAEADAYTERLILRELKDINSNLDAIKYNTGAVCEEARSGYLCKKF